MEETMWQFKTRNFTIRWIIYDCDCLDLSFDETGETAEKIKSGEWLAFDSAISVEYRGQEIGCDYLGKSIYANPADFRDHFGRLKIGRETGHLYGSYFSDMVRTAVRDAREYVREEPAPPVMRG